MLSVKRKTSPLASLLFSLNSKPLIYSSGVHRIQLRSQQLYVPQPADIVARVSQKMVVLIFYSMTWGKVMCRLYQDVIVDINIHQAMCS